MTTKRAAAAVPRANERTLAKDTVSAGPNAAAKKTAPAACSCSTKLNTRSTAERISGKAINGYLVGGAPRALNAMPGGSYPSRPAPP